VKAAHLPTAYSEKRPSYDFLNGPSGKGIDDLYTPEIACYPFTPPATCGTSGTTIENIASTWPPSRSVTALAEPE